MKLLYFTTVVNEEHFLTIQSQSRKKATAATMAFETALLHGMEQQEGLELTLRSFPMIAAYPGSKMLFWGARRETVASKLTTQWLPTINLYGLKQWSQKRSAKREIKHWLHENQYETEKAVLLYSVYEPIAVPVQKYCKKAGCKCFVIVPDLPRDMYKSLSRNWLKAAGQKLYMRRAARCQGNFDGYVYLTAAMHEVVAPSAPYTIVEGIADTSLFPPVREGLAADKRAIMYAGNVRIQFGVGNLIEAFGALKLDDIELWIFGTGKDEAEVEALAARDPRIRFFGWRDRETVLTYEQRASLLVNVRDPDDSFTKYSFPSKTIEYMLSGTPVLTTRLPGIPEEYNHYLLMIDDNAPKTVANGIRAALELSTDELRRFGENAAAFVAKEKNSITQTNKIMRFISQQIAGK